MSDEIEKVRETWAKTTARGGFTVPEDIDPHPRSPIEIETEEIEQAGEVWMDLVPSTTTHSISGFSTRPPAPRTHPEDSLFGLITTAFCWIVTALIFGAVIYASFML